MSIFKTAYDTTACSGYRISETQEKIKHALITGSLSISKIKIENYDNEFDICLVQGGNSTADTIPYFNHPLLLQDKSKPNQTGSCIIDVRNYGKWYAPQSKFIVRNKPEYEWNVLRGTLNHLWSQERVEIFRDLSILPVSVYGALISECVARKFALDPGEQIILSILSCYYYYCLFTDDKVFNETELNKIVGNIARATRAPASRVFELLDGLKTIYNLDELCEVFKEKTNSVRLNDFNVGVLIAVASGNWYGSNARENLAVALEHIPTWLMICYASLSEATFKRSVLAKLVDRFAKGGAGVNFIKSMDSILDTKNTLSKVDPIE